MLCDFLCKVILGIQASTTSPDYGLENFDQMGGWKEPADYLISPSLMMYYSGKKMFSCLFSGDISNDWTQSFEFLQSYVHFSNITYFHLFYLISCFTYLFLTLIFHVCNAPRNCQHIKFGFRNISQGIQVKGIFLSLKG